MGLLCDLIWLHKANHSRHMLWSFKASQAGRHQATSLTLSIDCFELFEESFFHTLSYDFLLSSCLNKFWFSGYRFVLILNCRWGVDYWNFLSWIVQMTRLEYALHHEQAQLRFFLLQTGTVFRREFYRNCPWLIDVFVDAVFFVKDYGRLCRLNWTLWFLHDQPLVLLVLGLMNGKALSLALNYCRDIVVELHLLWLEHGLVDGNWFLDLGLRFYLSLFNVGIFKVRDTGGPLFPMRHSYLSQPQEALLWRIYLSITDGLFFAESKVGELIKNCQIFARCLLGWEIAVAIIVLQGNRLNFRRWTPFKSASDVGFFGAFYRAFDAKTSIKHVWSICIERFAWVTHFKSLSFVLF